MEEEEEDEEECSHCLESSRGGRSFKVVSARAVADCYCCREGAASGLNVMYIQALLFACLLLYCLFFFVLSVNLSAILSVCCSLSI